MSKFERLLLILNLIRSKPGIKAPELASEAGVSQRTIYRDILSLASQYPVVSDNGYHMMPTAYLKTMNFTRTEYNLLQLALSCPALKRPDLRTAARSVKAKIDTVVDPVLTQSHHTINQFSPISLPGQFENRRIHAICLFLEKAIEQTKVVVILFHDSLRLSEVRICPYNLVYHFRDWLLVGYLSNKLEFDAFRLVTIKEVSISNQSFQKDKNFSLEEFFSSRWGIKSGEETVIKVHFTGAGARTIVEQKHHPNETLTKVGEREVHYAVKVKGTEEIMNWILGFGPEAEVLAPQSFREKVKEKVRGLSNLYFKRSKGEVAQVQQAADR